MDNGQGKHHLLVHCADQDGEKRECDVLQTIPMELRTLPQWVVWREVIGPDGKPTKVPFQTSGQLAKPNDSETWTDFQTAWDRYCAGGFNGVGFMFSNSDPYTGVDL